MSQEEHSSTESQSDVSEDNIEPQYDYAHYDSSANNFGFTPMEDPEVAEKKKRKREESEEARNLKYEIQTLLCRYPTLVPRTSHGVMDKLNALDDDELHNVYLNCLNDVSELRGNPIANSVIYGSTYFINQFIPGFTEECMNDIELKRNIESTVTVWLGKINTAAQMLFQFGNNAYVASRKRVHWDANRRFETDPFGGAFTFDDQLKKKEEEEKKKATLITPIHERDATKEPTQSQSTQQTPVDSELAEKYNTQAFAR